MKVLLVSNMFPDSKHPTYGVFVKKFADELDKLGIPYSEAVMHRKNGKISKILGYGAFFIKTFFKSLFGKYDVVYIHYASHSSAPVLAAGHFRKMNIYTNVHGSDVVPENSRQEKMQKYTKKALRVSRKIIVPSEYFKKYTSDKYGISEDNFYVYPSGGIDAKVFYEMDNKSELKKQFGIDNNYPVFGMAGRISKDKGWDTFLYAISEAKERGIKANYVIVGSGKEENKFDDIMKKLGLENDIIRIGLLAQDKLAEFYNAIDYFVFPTKREGESLGLVAIEAMACGKPVIASDFAAPKYYVNNNINGYKFEMGDSKSLADVITKCASVQNDEYTALKQNARKTAASYESGQIQGMLKKVFEEYSE